MFVIATILELKFRLYVFFNRRLHYHISSLLFVSSWTLIRKRMMRNQAKRRYQIPDKTNMCWVSSTHHQLASAATLTIFMGIGFGDLSPCFTLRMRNLSLTKTKDWRSKPQWRLRNPFLDAVYGAELVTQ